MQTVPNRASMASNSNDRRVSNPSPLKQSIAKGKTTLRSQGMGKYISEGARAVDSTSKTKRLAAKAAGKPPVNQRKPR
jgi:hypothetical protein